MLIWLPNCKLQANIGDVVDFTSVPISLIRAFILNVFVPSEALPVTTCPLTVKSNVKRLLSAFLAVPVHPVC